MTEYIHCRHLRLDRAKSFRRSIHERFWAVAVAALTAFSSVPSSAATFEVVKEKLYGDWKSILYRNDNGGRLFCALESEKSGTAFRINSYRAGGDTFLEVYNPSWTLMEGEVRFSFEFQIEESPLGMELRGKSWGDSYTYDLLDVSVFKTLLSVISAANSFKVVNSNGAPIATFPMSGSRKAVADFVNCIQS